MKDETLYTDLIQLTLSGNKEAYMRFRAKLSQAKDEMGAKEYEDFTKELKKLTNAKLEYGDSNGHIDYDQLSPAKRNEMKKIHMRLQPSFTKKIFKEKRCIQLLLYTSFFFVS